MRDKVGKRLYIAYGYNTDQNTGDLGSSLRYSANKMCPLIIFDLLMAWFPYSSNWYDNCCRVFIWIK